MTSEKQIAANQRNAKKSTGPKTPGGRTRSRMNAFKHGLRAETVVLPGEDPEEFNLLYESFREHYQPDGPEEEFHVYKIAEYTWRLQRPGRAESAMLTRKYLASEVCRRERELQIAGGKVQRLRYAIEARLKGVDTEPDREAVDSEESDDDIWTDLTKDEAQVLEDLIAEFEIAEEARVTAMEAFLECQEKAADLDSFEQAFSNSFQELGKFLSYEAMITKLRRNAITDLERLQARRKSEAANAATVIEGTVVDPTETAQDSRRSKSSESADVIDISASRRESKPKPKKIERVRLNPAKK